MEGGEKGEVKTLGCRLLIFPAPFQGHITPMLSLANLLHSKGFFITIIQTRFQSIDPSKFPHFTFCFIEDGYSGKVSPDLLYMISVFNTRCKEPFRDCLSRILTENAVLQERVACLIADPMWQFVRPMAESFKLPRMVVRTGSMSVLLVYSSLTLFKEKGYFPLQESKLDEPLLELPPLKLRDLPPEQIHDSMDDRANEAKTSQGIICNTFEEIESMAIAQVSQSLPVPVFSIGPLQRHSPPSESSIWTQDQSTLAWLDTQAPKSVLYVSFGSTVAMSKIELVEIAWSLSNSMQPFLWVIRPGSVEGTEENGTLPDGYLETVSGRGKIVKWAPQKEILAHHAVGGFWTHCGWNSTIESLSEGVPMICMPFTSDQPMNARYVSDSWRVGLRLEKGMKREEIEKVIRRLMVQEEGKEMRNRAAAFKEKASLSIMESGSSYKSLERLTSYLLSL